jgi:16S rRNA (guanine966-N2)-methyltransferase
MGRRRCQWRMRDHGPVTRIVAGTAKGRRIAVPARGTRPTADRVREALFSALESRVELPGARVLDLYAGSGALGLEALSRGAAHATFVEADRHAAHIVRQNANILGFRAVRVERAKVDTLLAGGADGRYDVVLADPPYDLDTERLRTMLGLLATQGWSGQGTVAVVERAAHSGELPWPQPWVALHTKRYGDTAVHWAVQE